MTGATAPSWQVRNLPSEIVLISILQVHDKMQTSYDALGLLGVDRVRHQPCLLLLLLLQLHFFLLLAFIVTKITFTVTAQTGHCVDSEIILIALISETEIFKASQNTTERITSSLFSKTRGMPTVTTNWSALLAVH